MQSMPKYIQVNDWIFEIKAVRALKVEKHGQPYSAIANININGENAYIDGLLTKDDLPFTRTDFDEIIGFCQNLDLSNVHFDRYKNGQMRSECVALEKKPQPTFLQLVN